jgi:hypothetical protein
MPHLPPPLQILDLICGSMKTQAIHACATFGIADLVKDEPQSLDDLARATGADQANVYRLLRLLGQRMVYTSWLLLLAGHSSCLDMR